VTNSKAHGRNVVTNRGGATESSRVLRAVPRHEGFHFYRSLGDSTGRVAVSLDDFAAKLKQVDVRAVNFHFKRQDFSKWVRDVIGDPPLAATLTRIRRDSHGEKLRTEILQRAQARLSDLKGT